VLAVCSARQPLKPTQVPASLGLKHIALADMIVASGALIERPDGFAVESPELRAVVRSAPQPVAELTFVYRGPTAELAPLASGERRQQVGLKLRARDACNIVYVMWHIEPKAKIEVSVKANPGQGTHEECGDRGYRFLTSPVRPEEIAPVSTGER